MIISNLRIKNPNLEIFSSNSSLLKYLSDNLNKEQLVAVTNINGFFLVIAGAGTGKTRIIIYRTYLLLSLGISPQKILILTFTKKAIGEIRSRVDSLFPNSKVVIETFHSLAYKILKKYSQNKSFKILTFDEYKEIFEKSSFFYNIKKILSEQEIKKILTKHYFTSIELKKDIQHLKKHEQKVVFNFLEDLKIIKIKKNLFTFNDLIENFLKFLSLNILPISFDYIMVDEYQDSDHFQLQILKYLSKNNLMVVGDDFQSIYGFKGSDVEIILNFPYHFPKVKSIILKQNYRSSNTIVNFTNEIANLFVNSFKKELHSDSLSFYKPSLNIFRNHEDELLFIKNKISELLFENQNNKIAVLFRNYLFMETFIKFFKKNNLNFSLIPNPFLENIFDNVTFDSNSNVELLSIHTSKGLEWDYVFIPLLLDGIIPTSIGDCIDIEEEKRLFYVASSRAKKQLFLSYPLTFYNDFGFYKIASPFITTISSSLYKVERG